MDTSELKLTKKFADPSIYVKFVLTVNPAPQSAPQYWQCLVLFGLKPVEQLETHFIYCKYNPFAHKVQFFGITSQVVQNESHFLQNSKDK